MPLVMEASLGYVRQPQISKQMGRAEENEAHVQLGRPRANTAFLFMGRVSARILEQSFKDLKNLKIYMSLKIYMDLRRIHLKNKKAPRVQAVSQPLFSLRLMNELGFSLPHFDGFFSLRSKREEGGSASLSCPSSVEWNEVTTHANLPSTLLL